MRQNDPDVRALQVDARVKEEHPGGSDDQRNDHRRDQNPHHQRAKRKAGMTQSQCGERSQHCGHQGGEESNDKAVFDGSQPVRVGEEILIPA